MYHLTKTHIKLDQCMSITGVPRTNWLVPQAPEDHSMVSVRRSGKQDTTVANCTKLGVKNVHMQFSKPADSASLRAPIEVRVMVRPADSASQHAPRMGRDGASALWPQA